MPKQRAIVKYKPRVSRQYTDAIIKTSRLQIAFNVVMVAAVLGLLAMIGWQNYVQPKPVATEPIVTAVALAEAQETLAEETATPPACATSSDVPVIIKSVSEDGKAFIFRHEGLRREPYNDAGGHCTIGIGHLLHTGPCDGSEEMSYVSEATARKLMAEDIVAIERHIVTYVDRVLNQCQFDAVASYVYGIGREAFTKSTLRYVINQGRFDLVPRYLLESVCVYGTGDPCQKSPQLVKIREQEINIFRNCIYPQLSAFPDLE